MKVANVHHERSKRKPALYGQVSCFARLPKRLDFQIGRRSTHHSAADSLRRASPPAPTFWPSRSPWAAVAVACGTCFYSLKRSPPEAVLQPMFPESLVSKRTIFHSTCHMTRCLAFGLTVARFNGSLTSPKLPRTTPTVQERNLFKPFPPRNARHLLYPLDGKLPT
ncbi:hypothetical protein J6590_053695 [Homalodisca vitripennis]|nr:hypothetical protein J6590_053695 [Homalodisca vitripennis]